MRAAFLVPWSDVIRRLAADELVWFLSRAYDFLGHSDPLGFASRACRKLGDLQREAERSFVLFRDDRPVAGAYVLAPGPDDDDKTLLVSSAWYDEAPEDLVRLVRELLEGHPHEAAYLPLFAAPEVAEAKLAPVAGALLFELDEVCSLRYDLSEVPPIGTPLVLEAWSLQTEGAFRDLYQRAEAAVVGDRRWAWLKRQGGSFTPDLWFLARETLDQEPVGYAFTNELRSGVDGLYAFAGVGVLGRYRDSSEMLRRLVVSTMHELAARSPFGSIETTLPVEDPKLIRILEGLGFEETDRYRRFARRP